MHLQLIFKNCLFLNIYLGTISQAYMGNKCNLINLWVGFLNIFKSSVHVQTVYCYSGMQ